MDQFADFELARLDDEDAPPADRPLTGREVNAMFAAIDEARANKSFRDLTAEFAAPAGIPADLVPAAEDTSAVAFARATHYRGAAELEPHPPGFCYVCGNALPADRALICPACADPNGAVAQTARMLRPTLDPATLERAARLYDERITQPTARVCVVPGCGQPVGPMSADGLHCTSCYAGES